MRDFISESRIEKLDFSLFGNTCEIDILRDDLIHPLISGNKWRKLKFIIEHIKSTSKKRIVTFGGAYSNHLVAAAVAGFESGIETIGFVRGNEERELNAYEQVCTEYGMKLIHTDRRAYRDKELLFSQYFGNDPFAEFVGEGGRHPMALKGCAEILDELNKEYDYIILALGTGTSMEGILKGITERAIPTKIIGISSLKNNFELDGIMSKYNRNNWQIEHDFHRGKYAKNDTDLSAFIEKFRIETAIRLEYVYTGKMMMALYEMLNSRRIEAGKSILCIHTGGLPQLINQ